LNVTSYPKSAKTKIIFFMKSMFRKGQSRPFCTSSRKALSFGKIGWFAHFGKEEYSMNRRQFLKVMGGGAGSLLLSQGFSALSFGQTNRMSLATGPVGGVYYILGGGMASVLSKNIPNLEVTSELTQGSVDNCRLVHMGKADMAMTMADIAFDAYSGSGRFKDLGKGAIQTLFVIYGNYLHTVAAGGKGIQTFFDLKGKRVSTGSPGSGSEIIC